MIENTCPHCNKNLRLAEDHVGKTIRCPSCQQPFVAYCMDLDAGEELIGDLSPFTSQGRPLPQAKHIADVPEIQNSETLDTPTNTPIAHTLFKRKIVSVYAIVFIGSIAFMYLLSPLHPDNWSKEYAATIKDRHTYPRAKRQYENYIAKKVAFIVYGLFLFVPLCCYWYRCCTRIGVYVCGSIYTALSLLTMTVAVASFTTPIPTGGPASVRGLELLWVGIIGMSIWAGMLMWLIAEQVYLRYLRRQSS